MNTNLMLLKAVDFVVDVDIVDVLVVAAVVGGKSLHAPHTISQNEPESHNGFLTINFYLINIPNGNITM